MQVASSLNLTNEDEDAEDDDTHTELVPLELARVEGSVLAKVVEYLKHYAEEPMKEIPQPLGGSTFNEVSPTGGIVIDSTDCAHMPFARIILSILSVCRS